MKDGDLYCYATIFVQTHGYMIRVGTEFARKITITEDMFEIEGTSGINTPNLIIKIDDVNKVIRDPRSRVGNSLLMVYPANTPEADVLKLIKPELREYLLKCKAAYEVLVQNAAEMIDALETECPKEYFCEEWKSELRK